MVHLEHNGSVAVVLNGHSFSKIVSGGHGGRGNCSNSYIVTTSNRPVQREPRTLHPLGPKANPWPTVPCFRVTLSDVENARPYIDSTCLGRLNTLTAVS